MYNFVFLQQPRCPCLECHNLYEDKNCDECQACDKRIEYDKACVPEWNVALSRFAFDLYLGLRNYPR